MVSCYTLPEQMRALSCVRLYYYIIYRRAKLAIRYGLDGSKFEPQCGKRFPILHTLPTQRPAQWMPCLFPEDKAAGAWRLPPTSSS
jgi:hypothetical protein